MSRIIIDKPHCAGIGSGMRKSVWVVEQGSYSDYSVLGVFSTKENAESACALVNTPDAYEKASVAEWQFDPGVAERRRGLVHYCVTMRNDGSVVQSHAERNHIAIDGDLFMDGNVKLGMKAKTIVVHCWAKSDIHAIKITNERRIGYILEGKVADP